MFVFWRVVRYAKYALVGSLVAAVAATGVGSFVRSVITRFFVCLSFCSEVELG